MPNENGDFNTRVEIAVDKSKEIRLTVASI